LDSCICSNFYQEKKKSYLTYKFSSDLNLVLEFLIL
jgi:hypothetical protein